MGQYLMTEHDPMNRTVFPDEIAFGGWFLDLHTPGGLLAPTSEPASAEGYDQKSEYAAKSYCGPYGIPLRSSISKDVDNLMMAGRNISVTHAALGTVRVMATTALVGQAVGTAAAVALERGITVTELPNKSIRDVQQRLLRDGCFLPNVLNTDEQDLARKAVVTSSSEALNYGVGPENSWTHGDLKKYALPDEKLLELRAQWIAIGGEPLQFVQVCLSNHTSSSQIVKARFSKADHIWDYRVTPSETFSESNLEIHPGIKQWVAIPVNFDTSNLRGYIRLDLSTNPNISWHLSGDIVSGHPSAFQMSEHRMRRLGMGHTLSFRLDPPQRCFGPEQVISGYARPYQDTNLWRSNPLQPLSQWLQLEWEKPMILSSIVLTFPGHLFREYHSYPPFYRDPQTLKDYDIQIWQSNSWNTLQEVRNNYQRHCKHIFQSPISVSKLRILALATNGDSAAGIHEVRVY